MQQLLKLHVIASGSRGNASVVEDVRTGRGLLIDCGISKKALFEGCAATGFDLTKLEGIVITHEHIDHTKGLGVAVRGLAKLGVFPALFVNDRVLASSSEVHAIADALDVRSFAATDSFTVAGIDVQAFPTSHDAAFSCGFRLSVGDVDAPDDALGFMTDTGVVLDAAFEALRGVRTLALESNHDQDMLAHGAYPAYVKKRIASARGHLSNVQASCALEQLVTNDLQHVIALHISENNNSYRLPAQTLTEALAHVGVLGQVDICVGYQKLPVQVR